MLRQELWLDADRFTEGNAETCPTGRILPVQGTPMDFTKPKAIGRDIDCGDEQLLMAGGYDHNFVLNKDGGMLALGAVAKARPAASAWRCIPRSPVCSCTRATSSANDGIPGKNGKPHTKYQGFCLEITALPCTPSHPDFPSVVLEPEEEYHETTVYQFKTE